jgi:hypothetical protein
MRLLVINNSVVSAGLIHVRAGLLSRRELWVRTAPYGFVAALFFAATLVLSWPWLSGGTVIPWDAKAHFWPQLVFLAHALHSGDSPFWTPNVFAGSPQIADPQSLIFSPPYLLLALVDSAPSFREADAVVFIMLLAAGAGMILFFQDRGWHPLGALTAALAFAFGGSASWRIQHTGQIMSLCWFVLALWLTARALDRHSARWGAAAGIAAGFLITGRDQVAFLSMLVLAGYVISRILSGGDASVRFRGFLGTLTAALASGIVVSALPIALSIGFALQSNRPNITFETAAAGSLHPANFLTAVAANLFNTAGDNYWGPTNSPVWGPPEKDYILARNMGDVYFGALPFLALMCFGFVRGAAFAREVRFFTIASGFLILYALGAYTPFFRLAFALPGTNLFRRPADATFTLGALLALLAGYALHRFVTRTAKALHGQRVVELGIIAALFIICFFLAWWFGHFRQALPSLALALCFFALAAFVLAFVKVTTPDRPALAMLILAVAIAFDLRISNKPNESTAVPPETYEMLELDTANEIIQLLKRKLAEKTEPNQRDRIELAALGFAWPNAGLVHSFDHDLGYNPLRLKLYADASGAGDQVAIPEQRKFTPLMPSYHSAFADFLGLRYIVTGVPAEEIDPRLRPGDLTPVARTKDGFVYENTRAMPRVLFADEALTADFQHLLQTGDWPRADLSHTVLLEGPTGEGSRKQGFARLVVYQNTIVTVDVDSPDGGWAVLNDVWHPWWQAEVDGKSVELLRANVAFRAVSVPPGHHIVTFSFRPFRGLWDQIKAAL